MERPVISAVVRRGCDRSPSQPRGSAQGRLDSNERLSADLLLGPVIEYGDAVTDCGPSYEDNHQKELQRQGAETNGRMVIRA